MDDLFSPGEREVTLARIIEMAEADERVEAAVLTGSIGSGLEDRWSDIDIALVVTADEDCQSIADDWMVMMYEEFGIAHHYTTAFGTTLVSGFLLMVAIEVDLAFTPVDEFAVWAPVRVAFDRSGRATSVTESPEAWAPTPDWVGEAGFFWHDVLHCCVAVTRGQSWRALYYLQRVRNRALALAAESSGLVSDEFKDVDRIPGHEPDRLLSSLTDRLDPASLLGAIAIATDVFLDQLETPEPDIAARLRIPLATVIHAAQEATGVG